MTRKKVCVIGAGIIGVSSALRILERNEHASAVTLISDTFSPDTTADGSAGILFPRHIGDTPRHLARRWGQETMDHVLSIIRSSDAGLLGAQMVNCYLLSTKDQMHDESDMSGIFPSYRTCTEGELAQFPGAKHGRAFVSALVDCKLYLPWLMKRFQDLGGKIEKKKVNSFEEVSEIYDIVVNCTGVRAGALTGDTQIIPARGQFIRVQAPWIKNVVYMDDFHILPCTSNVALGGVVHLGNWNLEISDEDTKKIWNSCLKIIPSLKHAKIDSVWTGLRPYRPSIRLEVEEMKIGNKTFPILHNYGHRGRGVTLHWGCAGDAAQIVGNLISKMETQSKL